MSLDASDKEYIREFVTNVITETREILEKDIADTRQDLKSDIYRLEVLLEDQATNLVTVLELLTNQLGITATLDDHNRRIVRLEASDKAIQKTVALNSRQISRLKGSNA